MEESPLTQVIEPARVDWRVREDVPMELKEGGNEGECTSGQVALPFPVRILGWAVLSLLVRVHVLACLLVRTLLFLSAWQWCVCRP